MKKYPAYILVSGALWGFMGLFRRYMADIGVSTAGVILLRCGVAAVLFGLALLITGPAQFKVKPQHIWCFVGAGLCSMLFFSYCYFQAMSLMSLSAAAILLYTAPAIVTVLSRFIFKESLGPMKLLALVLAFAGCALVSGIGGGSGLTTVGLLFGLGAGFGYAMYSIFARLALDLGYSSLTINFYSCLLSAVGAAVIWGTDEPVRVMFSSASNALLCVAAGIVTCFLPYMFYTKGLSGMETGRASIMASVEPVVATAVGMIFFKERLTPLAAAGIVLVLAAVVLLNVKAKQKHNVCEQKQ